MGNTGGAGPLAGVRVVELGVWVAGPAAGGIMADWGADVIKVEPAGGDPQRAVFGSVGLDGSMPVPPFEVDNRGKRSMVLDLRDFDDHAVFDRLLSTADVLVTNMRPGALERLELGPDRVCARHPRLVYGAISGYGLEGEDRDRAGYDIGAFWARSGLAHTMVPPGEMPPGLRSGMGDHQTGMTLVAGVMAKLFERERTGRGGLVSTSLLRTGMYSIAWDFGIQLQFDRRESTKSRENSRAPLINSYRASDERVFWLICLEADRHWPQVLAALERPDLADDPRYADATARMRHAADLIAEFDAAFATRPLLGVGRALRRARRVVGAGAVDRRRDRRSAGTAGFRGDGALATTASRSAPSPRRSTSTATRCTSVRCRNSANTPPRSSTNSATCTDPPGCPTRLR